MGSVKCTACGFIIINLFVGEFNINLLYMLVCINKIFKSICIINNRSSCHKNFIKLERTEKD